MSSSFHFSSKASKSLFLPSAYEGDDADGQYPLRYWTKRLWSGLASLLVSSSLPVHLFLYVMWIQYSVHCNAIDGMMMRLCFCCMCASLVCWLYYYLFTSTSEEMGTHRHHSLTTTISIIVVVIIILNSISAPHLFYILYYYYSLLPFAPCYDHVMVVWLNPAAQVDCIQQIDCKFSSTPSSCWFNSTEYYFLNQLILLHN